MTKKILLYLRYQFVDEVVENLFDSIQHTFNVREKHFIESAGRSQQITSLWHSIYTLELLRIEPHGKICNKRNATRIKLFTEAIKTTVRLKLLNCKKSRKIYEEGIYIKGPETNLYTQHVTEGLA